MITPKCENKLDKHGNLSQYKDIVVFYLHNFTVPGIPGRDLTAEEVERYGGMDKILSTGAYAKRRDEE